MRDKGTGGKTEYIIPIRLQMYTFVVAASLSSTYSSVRPGTHGVGGAPCCRPGYPAEGWVVHSNSNWYKEEQEL